jgi:hypothetical protein
MYIEHFGVECISCILDDMMVPTFQFLPRHCSLRAHNIRYIASMFKKYSISRLFSFCFTAFFFIRRMWFTLSSSIFLFHFFQFTCIFIKLIFLSYFSKYFCFFLSFLHRILFFTPSPPHLLLYFLFSFLYSLFSTS